MTPRGWKPRGARDGIELEKVERKIVPSAPRFNADEERERAERFERWVRAEIAAGHITPPRPSMRSIGEIANEIVDDMGTQIAARHGWLYIPTTKSFINPRTGKPPAPEEWTA